MDSFFAKMSFSLKSLEARVFSSYFCSKIWLQHSFGMCHICTDCIQLGTCLIHVWDTLDWVHWSQEKDITSLMGTRSPSLHFLYVYDYTFRVMHLSSSIFHSLICFILIQPFCRVQGSHPIKRLGEQACCLRVGCKSSYQMWWPGTLNFKVLTCFT